ncbi:MAG: helicase-related protein [Acetobacteraceae bacterium]|nr:helicase-related protein [Acetobacteraceae bacterium]
MLGFPSRVKAVLGPTNTGKTHLAMERMLAHSSGVIGFPLRLLARENYDRMVAQKGVRNVALITGEEKIVPAGARWFSCTVEAMPLDMPSEFVAVDEIQLCADADRGHVFTERLLHARGLVETVFLGAETIRPLLHRLVPHAEIETRPRLSQLSYVGPAKLPRLPLRTAIVAFSASEVYAIAESIRRRRGGCAVVMGRLSPRTRNAQVQLYQNKEVDFLVATDAIGMGLNMDVDHVAFARLTKFDGHRPRRLLAPEIAQIAGRAGRGMRDGTFGTTADCAPLEDELVHAVENHHFEPLEQLYWRNTDLDFGGVEALLASLQAPPPHVGLMRGPDAVDLQTLEVLARDTDVRSLATDRRRVRLLWETCGIPDFRKLADDTHSRLCARVFQHLVRDGVLPEGWLEAGIGSLARVDGDIDTLMQRLSGVRVWAYIAARPNWVPDAAGWQARTRQVEDLLSDSLHEKLTARFVDRRAAHLMRRLDESPELLSAVTSRGEVVVEGHPVGHVSGFEFLPDPATEGPERRLVLRAARRALREWMPRRVDAIEAATDAELGWEPDHKLSWGGVAVGRLRPGVGMLRPAVEVFDSEFLDGPRRERVRLRLQRFVTARIETALAPIFAAEAKAKADPALRGVLHRLIEAGGVLPGATEASVPVALRPRLKVLGVKAGRFALFMPALLKPHAAAIRAALLALRAGIDLPTLPGPSKVSLTEPAWPVSFAALLGWVEAGPAYIRLDIAERVAAELAWMARLRPAAVPDWVASRLAISREMVPAVLRGLGMRLSPAAALRPDEYGPPAPAMMQARRAARQAAAPVRAPLRPDSPFAALAAMRP